MPKVTLYALSTCPWCRKTKKFFAEHDIPFESTDYDLADPLTQDRITRELDAEGAGGFPFVRIDNQVVEGVNGGAKVGQRSGEILGQARRWGRPRAKRALMAP